MSGDQLHRIWGICLEPEAARTTKLRAAADRWRGGGIPTRNILPDQLPHRGGQEWDRLEMNLRRIFADSMLSKIDPPPQAGNLTVLHPDETEHEEQVRALYNGEIEPYYDEQGVMEPLPRVWHWELEWRWLWVIDLPRHLWR